MSSALLRGNDFLKENILTLENNLFLTSKKIALFIPKVQGFFGFSFKNRALGCRISRQIALFFNVFMFLSRPYLKNRHRAKPDPVSGYCNGHQH